MFPKSRPVRSESYRRWVASLPCAICGAEGWTQAAHGNMGKGLGLKVCDLQLFPACAPRFGLMGCHWQIDNTFQMTREERRELEAKAIAQTQALGREAGRRELKDAA